MKGGEPAREEDLPLLRGPCGGVGGERRRAKSGDGRRGSGVVDGRRI